MKKQSLFALLGYALLTSLMTWPTATQLTEAIPGDGFDGWQNYWNLWWIKEALLVKQTSFFFTDMLYPPDGASLLFHTLNYFNGLWTLPLQLNSGLAIAYNATIFFHYTLSGFGVYLLARYVLAKFHFPPGTKHWGAAFTAGLIFTFSPFHMAHLLGHMQVFSLTWPPFYMLWLLRTLLEGQAKPAGRSTAKDWALTGLFLSFTTMVDWYQTLYMLLYTVLLLLWFGWVTRRDHVRWPGNLLKPVAALTALGLLVGLLFAPLIIPMAREAATADYMRPTFEENVILSADLLAFFTPSELHPIWGQTVLPIYETFTTTTSERLVFAGFTPLILGVWAVYRYRKRPLVQLWTAHILGFFILALGPYLHIAGKIFSLGETPLPMPYLLLYRIIPFIGISRSLSRFDLMVMIGLGVLAALAMARLRPVLQGLVAALVIVEFIAIPYPMSQIDTPDFFQTMASEAETYTIAYLPMNWDRPVPLLYQTVHGKRLLTAYTSRQNPQDRSWRTPVLQQWRTLRPDIIDVDLAAVAPSIFYDFHLKYIVLDYFQMPPGPEREATETWVAAAIPEHPPIYEDERLKVFQMPSLTERRPYLQLGPEWGRLSVEADPPGRTIDGRATLHLSGPIPAGTQLIIETRSPYTLADLQIETGGGPQPASLTAADTRATLALSGETPLILLQTPTPLPITRLHLNLP